MRVSGLAETVTVTSEVAGCRHDAQREGEHPRRNHGLVDADPRPQVRRPPDADAGRERRAGTRRRRDHVCRTARHLQQHQPRRRRLHQRLLRRAGGRTARRDRHHARSRERVPGDRQRRERRVRTHGGRRRQRHHQVRRQRRGGFALLLPASRGPHREHLGRQAAPRTSIASSSAARSADR